MGVKQKNKQKKKTTYEAMSICICEHNVCFKKKCLLPLSRQRRVWAGCTFFGGEGVNQPHRSVYTQDNSTLEACECIHEKKINPCTVGVCLDGKNKEPRVDCAAKQQVERVIDDFAARFTFFFGGRGGNFGANTFDPNECWYWLFVRMKRRASIFRSSATEK